MLSDTKDVGVNMTQWMLIRYSDGTIREGMILAIEGATLRVAIRDGEDAHGFELVNGAWVSEDNRPAKFEFPLPAILGNGSQPLWNVVLDSDSAN